jgi:hypothetical protein
MEGIFMKDVKRYVLKQEKYKRKKVVQLEFEKASDADSLEKMINQIQVAFNVRTRSVASKFVLHLARTQFGIFAEKYYTLRETMDHYETLLYGAPLNEARVELALEDIAER